MTVAAILSKKGHESITVPADLSVRDAVGLLAERRIGAMPVLEDGRVIGIVSERDVIYCLARDGAAILDWPVSRIMSAPAVTVAPDQSVLGALSLITRRRIRHLPVVVEEELVGVVSIGDLVKHRMDAIENEAQAMLSYIQSA